MRRLFPLMGVLTLVLIGSIATAQTLTTDEPAPQKLWEVLLKLAFPIVMTVVGPLVTGLIKTAPTPVKYALATLTSMLLGAGIGSIPDFPLGPESAATIGATSGATGQALFLMQPKPPAPSGGPTLSLWGLLMPLLMILSLAGCATDADLGNGRVANLLKSEARSFFGVNDSRSRLRDCARERDPHDYTGYVYTDCHWMESKWEPSSSPGAGGMIVGGALIGVGAGVGGALTEGATAAASTTQSVVVPAARGHH